MDVQEFLKEIHFLNDLWMLAVPSVLMVLDFATGFLNAWARREVKSSKMRTGLAKKLGELAALVATKICVTGMMLPGEIMTGVTLYIVFMELVSICENLSLMGIRIPTIWKNKANEAHNYYFPDDKKDGEAKQPPDDTGWEIEHSASEDSETEEDTKAE